MFGGALVFGSVVVGAMVTFISLSVSARRTLDASTEQIIVEQQIADEIVSSAYEQQLIAYRFLEMPQAATLIEFRERGQRAYAGIRRYLFREMPVSARLKVESIKEAHQAFEIAAERAFDLASQGKTREAHDRVPTLQIHAAALERAVRSFSSERASQRRLIAGREEVALRRLQLAMMLVAVGLALTGLALAALVRRRVMDPLDELLAAVRRVGTDADHVRMSPQRYHEFDLLAVSFDGMADRIAASQVEIHERNRELTHTLEQLQRTQQELVQHEKLSAMGEMLAGLAHELNNPLGGVLGMAECLKVELEEPSLAPNEAREQELLMMATSILAEGVRARDLVRNLLHFSRQAPPQLDSTRLLDAVTVAAGLRRHAFTQSQKSIVLDVPGDLHVVAQAQKLQHVFINVMNNSLDALRDGTGGGRGTKLMIEARQDGDAVVIRLEDDGPGFRQPDRVFDPFYTTKDVGRGTGLGLSLVHRFVQEFGGRIRAENAPSGGARLTIRLVDGSVLRQRGEALDASAALSHTDRPALASDAAGLARVLVIDDEPALRAIQARMLSTLAVDVVLASSGDEGRAALETQRFDLVITDLRMPGVLSGHDLLAWLERERPALAATVLVVTGEVDGLNGGGAPIAADRLLLKPFSREEYLERVRRALALSHGMPRLEGVRAA
jgi:C4-dicarboxylate-specific signal transduction histidine kinase